VAVFSICTAAKGQSTVIEVKRIRTIKKYYVIYVTDSRNLDYKVVSKKERVSGCERIRRNECYALILAKVNSMAGAEVNVLHLTKRLLFAKNRTLSWLWQRIFGAFV